MIGDEMRKRGWTPENSGAFIDRTKKTDKARLKWYKQVEKDIENQCFTEIVEIARENNPEFSLKANISIYGASNKSEFFAEVFANSQLGAPNELGKAADQWLKKKGY
jgi:Mlc titration factor MtfA (ptsG expression regulator)